MSRKGTHAVSEDWVELQKRAFTKWANLSLSSVGMSFVDVAVDVKNGVMLCALLEVLSEKSIVYEKKPKNPMQEQENCGKAVKFAMEEEGIKLNNIGGTDLHAGNQKLVLGFIFSLILHYGVGAAKWGDSTLRGRARCVHYVSEVGSRYGLSINNLTTCLEDGLVLAALVHMRRPDLIDPRLLSPAQGLDNITRSLDLMHRHFGLSLDVIDAADLGKDADSSLTFFTVAIPKLEEVPIHPDAPPVNPALVWRPASESTASPAKKFGAVKSPATPEGQGTVLRKSLLNSNNTTIRRPRLEEKVLLAWAKYRGEMSERSSRWKELRVETLEDLWRIPSFACLTQAVLGVAIPEGGSNEETVKAIVGSLKVSLECSASDFEQALLTQDHEKLLLLLWHLVEVSEFAKLNLAIGGGNTNATLVDLAQQFDQEMSIKRFKPSEFRDILVEVAKRIMQGWEPGPSDPETLVDALALQIVHGAIPKLISQDDIPLMDLKSFLLVMALILGEVRKGTVVSVHEVDATPVPVRMADRPVVVADSVSPTSFSPRDDGGSAAAARIAELEEQVRVRDERLRQEGEQLALKDGRIDSLQAELDELDEQVRTLVAQDSEEDARLREKDALISNLQNELASLKEGSLRELADANLRADEGAKEASTLKARVESLERSLAEAQDGGAKEANTLKARVESLESSLAEANASAEAARELAEKESKELKDLKAAREAEMLSHLGRNEDLILQLAQVTGDREAKTKELAEMTARLGALQQGDKALQAMKDSLNDKLEALKKQAKADAEGLKGRIRELELDAKADEERHQKEMTELATKSQKAREAQSSAKGEVADLHARIRQLEKEVTDLQAELARRQAEAEAQSREAQDARAAAETEVAALKAELERRQAEAEAQSRKAQDAQAAAEMEVASLKADAAKNKEKMEELLKQIQELERIAGDKDAEGLQSRSALMATNKELAEATRELEQLRERLRHQESDRQAEMQLLTRQLAELKEQHEEHTRALTASDSEQLAAAKREIEELKLKLEGVESEKQRLEALEKTHSADSKAAREREKGVQGELAQTKETLATVRRELDEAKRAAKTLGNDLDAAKAQAVQAVKSAQKDIDALKEELKKGSSVQSKLESVLKQRDEEVSRLQREAEANKGKLVLNPAFDVQVLESLEKLPNADELKAELDKSRRDAPRGPIEITVHELEQRARTYSEMLSRLVAASLQETRSRELQPSAVALLEPVRALVGALSDDAGTVAAEKRRTLEKDAAILADEGKSNKDLKVGLEEAMSVIKSIIQDAPPPETAESAAYQFGSSKRSYCSPLNILWWIILLLCVFRVFLFPLLSIGSRIPPD